MKEAILYEPYNDMIFLALKDDRTLVDGKWQQRWWIYNGEMSLRPATNEAAEPFFKKCIVLESARFLDEYR